MNDNILAQVTHLRRSIGVGLRVAITIWKLATNIEFRTLSGLFGLGRSTVGVISMETCQAIVTHLLPLYVHTAPSSSWSIVTHLLPLYVHIPHGERVLMGSRLAGIFLKLQVLLMAHTYPLYAQTKVHQTITIGRVITQSLCKLWWTFADYSWMYILDGLGKSMMPGCL